MLGKLYGLRVMCTTRSPYSLGRPKNALRWILPLPCSTRPCLAFAMPQPSQTILSCAIALHHSSALYDATASLSSAPPLLISPLLCVDWRYLAARGFAFASLCSALCCTAFARHICTIPLHHKATLSLTLPLLYTDALIIAVAVLGFASHYHAFAQRVPALRYLAIAARGAT
jgi:hypothetical protein